MDTTSQGYKIRLGMFTVQLYSCATEQLMLLNEMDKLILCIYVNAPKKTPSVVDGVFFMRSIRLFMFKLIKHANLESPVF